MLGHQSVWPHASPGDIIGCGGIENTKDVNIPWPGSECTNVSASNLGTWLWKLTRDRECAPPDHFTCKHTATDGRTVRCATNTQLPQQGWGCWCLQMTAAEATEHTWPNYGPWARYSPLGFPAGQILNPILALELKRCAHPLTGDSTNIGIKIYFKGILTPCYINITFAFHVTGQKNSNRALFFTLTSNHLHLL